MRLNERTDIALRLLIFLAVRGARTPVAEVATAFRVSDAHLAKAAQALVHAGFVDTIPGRHGGVGLAREPADIRVGAVVRALEPLELVECFGPDNTCPVAGVCGLEPALAAAREAFLASLDGVTLAEAARHRGALARRLGQGARAAE